MYLTVDSVFFFFKQKTAYEMRISDGSSDVCSSDLSPRTLPARSRLRGAALCAGNLRRDEGLSAGGRQHRHVPAGGKCPPLRRIGGTHGHAGERKSVV